MIKLSYLICTTPRTGSNFLCEVLSSTGVAGSPDEYFWNPPYWSERWGVEDFPLYVNRMLREGTTHNGVFGIKLMYGYLDDVLSRLRELTPPENPTPPEILQATFPNPHYIWLTRKDKIRQGISHYRALQTSLWRSTDLPSETTPEPTFNFEEIHGLIQLCTDEDQAWRDFFNRHAIEPLTIYYEDLAENPEAIARSILRSLGIEAPADFPAQSWRHERQADALTEQWVKEYRTRTIWMPHRNHEVSIREGYAVWAPFYDHEQNPLIATEEPRVAALFETIPPPARVLDVATGTGRHALRFARQGANVTAIDQSPEMLAVAQQKATAQNLSIDFVEGALEDGLPFSNDAFDLAICALALSSVPDLDNAIRECARVLRPGGHLLITDFHPQAIKNGWQPTIFRGEDAYILPTADHSAWTYIDAVRNSDCEIVHLEEILVRQQDPATIQAPDINAFLEQFGDWPFCLILLARQPEPGVS